MLVNRVWQHHFGRGIVATPSNFGTRGSPPSHPELLDWLTASFVEHGWSIKSLHRLIMQSKTYQLASHEEPADEAIDPTNRWYWRFDRQRLDAEAIRDAMLDVSGVLDLGGRVRIRFRRFAIGIGRSIFRSRRLIPRSTAACT